MRQNPHNVAEWLNRVELFKQKEKPHEIINTYTEAVQTVDPKQAVGKLHHLWVNFAKFYDENDQLEDARVILEKATHVAFLKVCMTLKSIRFLTQCLHDLWLTKKLVLSANLSTV